MTGADAPRSCWGVSHKERRTLADGVVRNLATGATSGVFTNSSGRAVLSKLAEGRYRVELMGGDMVFEFTVDKSAPAIIKLGTQMMEVAP